MTLSLILFDCDGTLANSEGFISRCATEAFEEEGMTHLLDINRSQFLSMSFLGFFEHLGDQLSANQREKIQTSFFRQLRSERDAGKLCEPLFDGIRPVLEDLHAQGYLLGIATNKGSHGLKSVLKTNGIEHLFCTEQTSDNSPTKPAPAMVENAMKETGVERENCILVGDTLADVLLARNAGISCIGATWNKSSRLTADDVGCIVSRIEDLVSAIHRILPPPDVQSMH